MVSKGLIILGILAIVGALVYSSGAVDKYFGGKMVECKVSLWNPLLKEVYIDRVTCSSWTVDTCAGLSVAPLSIVDSGKLEMVIGNNNVAREYNILENNGWTYTLSDCVDESEKTVVIQIFDDKQKPLGTESISI